MMGDLITILIAFLESTAIIPTITSQDISNYIAKENQNGSQCRNESIPDSRQYQGTTGSIANCASGNAIPFKKDPY